MRYRFAKSADLQTFRLMLDPAFQASPRVSADLVNIWETLMSQSEIRITVVEDPGLSQSQAIQVVAASVFVREDLAEEFNRSPRPGLAAEIYERILAGQSPILSHREVRAANSGKGLDLVMLHFALRNPDLTDPQVQQLMIAVNAAFFFFYGGYRLNSAMQEVYGNQAAEYMRAGGFHIVADFKDYFTGRNDLPPPDLHPYLLGLRKEAIQPAVVSPLSFLFFPVQPRIHFSPSEQAVLERALLTESDLEISQDLGVSLDAIKKTWRRIYHRAAKTEPYLMGNEGIDAYGARGSEKRRHLLEYLRIHLEELRPHELPKTSK